MQEGPVQLLEEPRHVQQLPHSQQQQQHLVHADSREERTHHLAGPPVPYLQNLGRQVLQPKAEEPAAAFRTEQPAMMAIDALPAAGPGPSHAHASTSNAVAYSVTEPLRAGSVNGLGHAGSQQPPAHAGPSTAHPAEDAAGQDADSGDDNDGGEGPDGKKKNNQIRKPHLQGRFSGRLATKEDEKKLLDECKLLGPLLGGSGKRGDKSRLTLAKIVRGIASGEVRQHCQDREKRLQMYKEKVKDWELNGMQQINRLKEQNHQLQLQLQNREEELAARKAEMLELQQKMREMQGGIGRPGLVMEAGGPGSAAAAAAQAAQQAAMHAQRPVHSSHLTADQLAVHGPPGAAMQVLVQAPPLQVTAVPQVQVVHLSHPTQHINTHPASIESVVRAQVQQAQVQKQIEIQKSSLHAKMQTLAAQQLEMQEQVLGMKAIVKQQTLSAAQVEEQQAAQQLQANQAAAEAQAQQEHARQQQVHAEHALRQQQQQQQQHLIQASAAHILPVHQQGGQPVQVTYVQVPEEHLQQHVAAAAVAAAAQQHQQAAAAAAQQQQVVAVHQAQLGQPGRTHAIAVHQGGHVQVVGHQHVITAQQHAAAQQHAHQQLVAQQQAAVAHQQAAAAAAQQQVLLTHNVSRAATPPDMQQMTIQEVQVQQTVVVQPHLHVNSGRTASLEERSSGPFGGSREQLFLTGPSLLSSGQSVLSSGMPPSSMQQAPQSGPMLHQSAAPVLVSSSSMASLPATSLAAGSLQRQAPAASMQLHATTAGVLSAEMPASLQRSQPVTLASHPQQLPMHSRGPMLSSGMDSAPASSAPLSQAADGRDAGAQQQQQQLVHHQRQVQQQQEQQVQGQVLQQQHHLLQEQQMQQQQLHRHHQQQQAQLQEHQMHQHQLQEHQLQQQQHALLHEQRVQQQQLQEQQIQQQHQLLQQQQQQQPPPPQQQQQQQAVQYTTRAVEVRQPVSAPYPLQQQQQQQQPTTYPPVDISEGTSESAPVLPRSSSMASMHSQGRPDAQQQQQLQAGSAPGLHQQHLTSSSTNLDSNQALAAAAAAAATQGRLQPSAAEADSNASTRPPQAQLLSPVIEELSTDVDMSQAPDAASSRANGHDH